MWLKTINNDIQSVLQRDPAARNYLEVLLCYPGLHAVLGYRAAHWFWKHHFKLAGRLISQLVRYLTGVEIHPGASIDSGFFIDHGMGVVIGETAEVGKNVTLYNDVTLGGVSLEKGKRHPTIGNNVVIGTGAKILGAFTVGENSRIGANAVVVKPVPPNSVVVGVPGQVVIRSRPLPNEPDLHHDRLPDAISAAVNDLLSRMDKLEKTVHIPLQEQPVWAVIENNGNGYLPVDHLSESAPVKIIHSPENGVWHEEDFMI